MMTIVINIYQQMVRQWIICRGFQAEFVVGFGSEFIYVQVKVAVTAVV
jgi:hypothetical protein